MRSIVLMSVIAIVCGQFQCPSKHGQYPDEIQCDKYWNCYSGEAKALLCPDGLVFDPTRTGSIYKCDYPFSVDCGNRTMFQPPQSSTNCPRRNGFYPHSDLTICDVYFSCINGVAKEMKCPEGLFFNKTTGLCKSVPPRNECRNIVQGFDCPKMKRIGDNSEINLYPKMSDCQKFYVCSNGRARELTCPVGDVYNDVIQKCDRPENVPGCEDWYQKYEEYD